VVQFSVTMSSFMRRSVSFCHQQSQQSGFWLFLVYVIHDFNLAFILIIAVMYVYRALACTALDKLWAVFFPYDVCCVNKVMHYKSNWCLFHTLCNFIYLFSVPTKKFNYHLWCHQSLIKNSLKLSFPILFNGKADKRMSSLSLGNFWHSIFAPRDFVRQNSPNRNRKSKLNLYN